MGAPAEESTDNAADSAAVRGVRVLLHAWVFALVLALYPYVTNPASPIKLLVSTWLVFAMALLYAAALLRRETTLRLRGLPLAAAAAFIGIHLLSAFVNNAPLRGILELRAWIAGLVLAVIAGQVLRRPAHALRLLLTLCVAVALSSVYGYLQRFGLDPFPWSTRGVEEYIGMPSTYANPNFAGHTLLLALIIAGGLLLHRGRWWWLLAPCMALIASHLVLTHMRGARVGLMAAVLFTGLVALLLRRGARPVQAAAGLMAAGLLVAAAGIAAALASASLGGDGALPLDGASVLRLNGYFGAARMALTRPVFGFGPGSYDVESPRFWTPYEQQWFASENKKNDHVHNDLLETAADGGIPAAGLYIALLISAILTAFQLAKHGHGACASRLGWILGACFVAFAVDGLFGFNLRVPVSAGFFFLLLGLLHSQSAAPPGAGRLPAAIAALALLIMAFAAAIGSTAVFRSESLLQQARGAQAYGKDRRDAGDAKGATLGYEAGIRLGLAAASWQPFDSRNTEIAGVCATALGRYQEADQYLAAAIAVNPNNPTLHAMQAMARSSALFSRDELDVFGKQPDPVVLNLAIAAEHAAQRALALCPNYAAANEALGRIYEARAAHDPAQRVKDLANARVHLENALRNGARGRASLNSRIAEISVALDDTDAAETAFKRALEVAPDDESLWDSFAAFAMANDRAQSFADALEKSAARAEGGLRDDLAMRLAYFAAFSLKNVKQGRDVALETVRRAPGNPAAWGLLLLTAGDTSLAGLKKVVSENSAISPPAWIGALSESPTGAGYVAAANGMAQAMPGGLSVAACAREYRWAATLLERGLPEAALSGLEEGQVRLALAEIYSRCGRPAEALRNADRAGALLETADRTRALVLAARALAEMGRGPEALVKAREAARLSPADRGVRHVLARLLLDEGLLAEARFEYAALIKSPPPGQEAAVDHEAAVLEARLNAANAGGGA